MKIISRYVLREHAGPLVFALSATTSLLLLNYIAKQFGNLVGKGLPWDVIAEFFALSIPFTVAMTVPMAVLVATLYAFSRMAAENEITALKASGVSMKRLMIPVLIAASIVSLLLTVFNDQALPRANHKLRTLQGDIARKKPTFALREQVLNEVSPGRLFLRANHVDPYRNWMREVTIYDLADPLRRRTIYADSGTMAFAARAKGAAGTDLQLTLFTGYVQEIPRNEPQQLQRLFFHVDRVKVAGVANDLERTEHDDYKSDREMTVCEMQRVVNQAAIELAMAKRDLEVARGKHPPPLAAPQLPPSAGAAPDTTPPGVKRVPIPPEKGLGVVYCHLLDRLSTLQLPKLGVKSASAAVLPARQDTTVRKPAQDTTKKPAKDTASKAAQDTTKKPAQDTTKKPVQDTTKKTAQDSAARARDTTRRVAGDTTFKPRGIIPTEIKPIPTTAIPAIPAPAAVDTTHPPSGLPVFPSAVRPSTAPATGLATSGAIEAAKARISDKALTKNSFLVEIHKKFALSATCIVFVLLGAPIALRFPRGGIGLTLGVSLVVFAIYYIGLIAGESLGNRGIIPPFWGMWGTNVLFSAIGLVLMARMGKEASTSRGGDWSEISARVRGWFGWVLHPPIGRRGRVL